MKMPGQVSVTINTDTEIETQQSILAKLA